MGYVTHNLRRPWLIVDLETAAIEDIDTYADDMRIDSRLRDQTKIDAARAAALDKAALDCDLSRIVALGLWASSSWQPSVTTIDGLGTSESVLVGIAWDSISECLGLGGQIVSFNGLNFDFSLLIRRAQFLQVRYTPLELNRFRPGPLLDLMNYLSFNGAKPARSLSFYARRFGLGIDDPLDGSDMAALIAAGDWPSVAAHNRADLRRTQALAERLGLIGPPENGGTHGASGE